MLTLTGYPEAPVLWTVPDATKHYRCQRGERQ